MTPYANNIGTELNDDNLNSFVAEPNSICTETFILIGAEQGLDEKQCINITRYLESRFARFMLLMAVSSINLSKEKFRFVPLQDFTHAWTDKDLYEMYNLSEDEISYIERLIKPLE